MPSARSRQSTPIHRLNRAPAVLPAYQPLKNPLNESAQRALHDLPRAHNLANLNKHLQIANDTLTNAAGDVNDRYQRRAAYQLKQNAQGKGEEGDEGNRSVEEMRENVDGMTSRVEEGVRKVIDARAIVAGVESALKELDTNVAAGNGAIAPTQSTLGASQFRQRRRIQEDDDSEDESSQEVVIGPTTVLKRKITEQQAEYEGLSMRDRCVPYFLSAIKLTVQLRNKQRLHRLQTNGPRRPAPGRKRSSRRPRVDLVFSTEHRSDTRWHQKGPSRSRRRR